MHHPHLPTTINDDDNDDDNENNDGADANDDIDDDDERAMSRKLIHCMHSCITKPTCPIDVESSYPSQTNVEPRLFLPDRHRVNQSSFADCELA